MIVSSIAEEGSWRRGRSGLMGTPIWRFERREKNVLPRIHKSNIVGTS